MITICNLIRISAAICLTMTIGIFAQAAEPGAEESPLQLYAAPDGNDAWDGMRPEAAGEEGEGPLATLTGARDRLRKLREAGELPASGVTVHVQPGRYFLDEPFVLEEIDSGTASGPITFSASGEVIVTGGKRLEGFEQATAVLDSSTLARIPEEARAHVLVCDVKAQGITDYGELTPRGFGRDTHPSGLELFYNDTAMTLARWPNEGWIHIAETPQGSEGGMFTYEGERPSRWVESNDVWLHGYWTWDWADSYVQIARIDPESKAIHTREPHGVYGYKAGQRFYALNILEELDAPGEWYLDRESGHLYFWPPSPIENGKALVSIAEELVRFEGARHVTLEGMTVEACRGAAITLEDAEHCTVAGCTIRNTGTSAVEVHGGANNTIQSCDITGTGGRAIALSGGDRKTLESAGHIADNNHIHHYARWCRTYRPAVLVSGVGMKVSHNRIHDAPHTAVLWNGNEHTFEYNDVSRVALETGDVGAFYMGRDWTMRGNVVRHNCFHDIQGPYTHGAMSVYLDDAASGTRVIGNVFYKASRAAFIGGGRDNTVENNLFIECAPAVHVDARSLNWASEHAQKGGAWHMYEKLEAVDYDEPPYSERYPNLPDILDNEPHKPLGNVVARNVNVGGKWLDLPGVQQEWITFEDNLTDGDEALLDLSGPIPRLKQEAPEVPKGFEPIPVDQIGLYTDTWRTQVPSGGP